MSELALGFWATVGHVLANILLGLGAIFVVFVVVVIQMIYESKRRRGGGR